MGLFNKKKKVEEEKEQVISMNPTSDIIVPDDFDGDEDIVEQPMPQQVVKSQPTVQKVQPKTLEQEKGEILAKLKAIAEQEEAVAKAEEERKQQEAQVQQPQSQQVNLVQEILTRLSAIELRLARAGI